MGACFLMEDVNHVTAYRSELEGIFRTLSQLNYLNMTPSEVLHWCDNEQSVASTAKPLSYAGGMLDADADLVLAIHTLKSELPFPVDCRHVYGHQDDKKKQKKMKEMEKAKRKLKELEKAKNARQRQLTQSGPQPHHLQPSTSSSFDSSDKSVTSAEESVIDLFCLRPQTSTDPPSEDEKVPGVAQASVMAQARKERPKEVKINIACDHLATDTTNAALDGGTAPDAPVLRLPYKGSKAMFKIKGQWITSRFKSAIHRASRTERVRTYYKTRHKWDDETFDLVNWHSVGSVRNQLSNTKKMQTSKMMCGWLPIMHMRQFITGSSQCPGCLCTDETMEHLSQCPNEKMCKTREEAMARIKKLAKKRRIPQEVATAFCHYPHRKFGWKAFLPANLFPGHQKGS